MEYDFRRINFGSADAHTEGEDYPELLREGFIDISDVVGKALDTSVFLFLGYKGSGKSSLSEHLKVMEDRSQIIDQQALKDFPFKEFDKLSSVTDKTIRYKSLWNWLLCTKIWFDLREDEYAISDKSKEIKEAINIFTRAGILSVTRLSSLVNRKLITQITLQLKHILFSQTINSEVSGADYDYLADYIKALVVSYKEARPIYMIIDDLDDILAPNGNQFSIISALINVANDLNRFFRDNNLQVKILVLCRTDMFERLSDPNKNKIKQDKSFTFSWYKEGVDTAKKSDLVKLINKRMRIVYPEVDDVFNEFFPVRFEKRDTCSALLDYTRHTPRDFVALMNCIKKYCSSNKVTEQAISDGLTEYSLEYFKQEIDDEITGYLTRDERVQLFEVLSTLRRKEFSYTNFVEHCKKQSALKRKDLVEVLRLLYDCSAIGHIYEYDARNTRYTFKYRNRNSSFSRDDKITLHKGLWKALNVNY